MWTKIKNGAAVVSFVFAGLFLWATQLFSFFIFSAKGKDLFRPYSISFLIFAGSLALGMVLRGFQRWKRCFGSVLLSVAAVDFFVFLSFLCDYGAPGDVFKMQRIKSMILSPWPGFVFCAVITLFGFLLVRSGE